jgi:hypothetical protein
VDGGRVDSDVRLDEGFRAEGKVRLPGVTIGGQLVCSKGHFVIQEVAEDAVDAEEDRDALTAEGAKVGGDVFLDEGFRTNGWVNLSGSTITGDVTVTQAEFCGDGENGLIAKNARITGEFIWKGITKTTGMRLDLDAAEVDKISDDRDSWPDEGNLFLNGFVYASIDPQEIETRLHWLGLQDKNDFPLQPYDQLAQALYRSGHEADSKRVAITKEAMRLKYSILSRRAYWWGKVLGITIGYGHMPELALLWAFFFIVIGWGVFSWGYDQKLMSLTRACRRTL